MEKFTIFVPNRTNLNILNSTFIRKLKIGRKACFSICHMPYARKNSFEKRWLKIRIKKLFGFQSLHKNLHFTNFKFAVKLRDQVNNHPQIQIFTENFIWGSHLKSLLKGFCKNNEILKLKNLVYIPFSIKVAFYY